MGMIRIDYSEAIGEANRLISVANDCHSNNSKIDSLIKLIPTYWQGESANAFIDELQQWKKENDSIRTEANELAYTIKKVADEIRAAERRAIAGMKANDTD